MQINKYQKYEAIDFLKDDDFLRWNLFHSEEDDAYWEDIMNRHSELRASIEKAVQLYKTQIHLNDYLLTVEQIESYHDEFQYRIRQQKRHRSLYYWFYGAASILLLFAVNHFFKPFVKQESELVNFVKRSSFVIDSISEDIQLYVSADQLITIEEKDAYISYHADSIKLTGKPLAEANAVEFSRLVVPKGKRSKIVLSDGTTLYVNSGTKVIYPHHFTDKVREIYVNGEVYLEVAHNPKQPFIVRTDEIAVRVTGTKFNVQAYEEDAQTQVVLASGGVQIIPNNHLGKTDLEPSQLYDYSEGRTSVKHVDVERYISWVDGLIYVEDERLDLLMIKLSRYYGEEILFDTELGDQRCTGKVYLKDNLADVLNGLTFSFQIRVEQEDGVYRVRAK